MAVPLSFAVESAPHVMADAMVLFAAHHAEVGQDMPLKPATQRYLAMERNGGLLACTARRDGVLVGYAVFFILFHWHYADFLVAQNDIIFLDQSARHGTAAIRLMDFAETELARRGVEKVYYHVKLAQDWSAILERRGARQEERVFGKALN